MFRTSAPLGIGILVVALAAPAHAETDWTRSSRSSAGPRPAQPGGVHRFSLPRSDLKVTLDGIAIKPALALGSWLAFEEAGDQTMVMGDLVLTEAEVNPVMSSLAESGIEITALHNHLLGAQPATMYMHVEGHGDAVKLAQALRLALEESQTPIAFQPAAGDVKEPALDTAALAPSCRFQGGCPWSVGWREACRRGLNGVGVGCSGGARAAWRRCARPSWRMLAGRPIRAGWSG